MLRRAYGTLGGKANEKADLLFWGRTYCGKGIERSGLSCVQQGGALGAEGIAETKVDKVLLNSVAGWTASRD